MINPKHKLRLLRKLEAVQSELHEKTSTVENIFALVGFAGLEFGKFGNNIKPLTDRIRELAEIVFKAIRLTEDVPALPDADKILQLGDGE